MQLKEVSSSLSEYYDAVPYESMAFPQSAPEHLQAVAGLFGLSSPPIETARVLELGCAAGGNLLPFAARYPRARVLGVDLSSVQVEQGKALIAEMGLKNAEIRRADLSTLARSLGTFDYIICHGVYSWVPESVRKAILRIASENLSDNGLAYVSYNTYPGWKSREIVRDAMILRGGSRELKEKLPYARGMLEYLYASARPDTVLKLALEEMRPILQNYGDYYLLHEFLEPYNAPCYFHEFVERAEANGLDYVGESETFLMFLSNYSANIAEPLLREWGSSQVSVEQYLDFVNNRGFRQTILAKKNHASGVRRQLSSDMLQSLFLSGVFVSEDGPLTPDEQPQACNLLRRGTITLSQPALKVAAAALNEAYPATLSFDALAQRVITELKLSKTAAREQLLPFVEELVIKGFLRFRMSEPDIAAVLPDRPVVSDETRATLKPPAGTDAVSVSNLLHEPVYLNILEARVALLMDGSRDEEALIAGLVEDAGNGLITFLNDGAPVSELAAIEEAARKQVPIAAASLRAKGLIRRAKK
ncbi:methyltransferase domain-containing protein [Agrobacterium rhizogenes]|uniref:class I SAM-dependent methyltransferase n=1 Tax=Rhizobium rhizogenes TaxID=359 RepID=UPI000564F97E|nr:class I SAM-dependent methyltransferase [Rhizobium rhizogenes]NTF83804.1 methyltransferase domain-containing protein [Rhizobium rhizogenes]NTH79855.1 methyltransferase domain-containing protein [Rhizobium rhizogenes]NTH85832.1 methyltransferase domain-containing protein [Rhizobium rhizogenes]